MSKIQITALITIVTIVALIFFLSPTDQNDQNESRSPRADMKKAYLHEMVSDLYVYVQRRAPSSNVKVIFTF